MERRGLAERGLAKFFRDKGRRSIREKGISYPILQGVSTCSPPDRGCSTLREEKLLAYINNDENAGTRGRNIEYSTFPRIQTPKLGSNFDIERSPSFKFDPSQYRDHPPSQEEVGGNSVNGGPFRISSSPTREQSHPAQTATETRTVRRSEVMKEGQGILKKIKKYSFDQKSLAPEIEVWLDEYKVKVLTEEAKNLVAWWASNHSQIIVEWMREAVPDIEEYTYTYELRQGEESLLRWCHMMARPLRELRHMASTMGGDHKQMLFSLVGQIENGCTWLDEQEQLRQDASRAAMEREAKARSELESSTKRLERSREKMESSQSRMDEIFYKMSDALRVNELKNHGSLSKKRRLESSSDGTNQAADDVQDLIDTLMYQLSTTSDAFAQLKKVAQHFGPEVSTNLDFDRDRCLSRRKLRMDEGLRM